jgi:hypothetical protein
MTSKTYYDNIGTSLLYIKYELNENRTVYLHSYFFPPEYIKMFIQLYVKSIDDLISNNYEYLIQTISDIEYNEFFIKDTRIEIIKNNKDSKDIKCKISDAPNIFYDVLTK